MTTKAYVLIETKVGMAKQVVDTLRKLSGVLSVDSVSGPYDAIAIVQADNLNDIGALIVGKVQTAGGISRTITCLIL
jgi:DNA-binding Lrp family transcriptional regulator